jgi:hypothetical protein
VEIRHETDTPHQRINAFAKPNGAGLNGPGGARLINATKNSATIASQKDSQNPSMYATNRSTLAYQVWLSAATRTSLGQCADGTLK